MSRLEDLKEQLIEKVLPYWNEFRENPTVLQIKEQYEGLSLLYRRGILVGLGLFLFFIIGSIPYAYFSESTELVGEFEESIFVVKELLKVKQEKDQAPAAPAGMDLTTLRNRVDSISNSPLLTDEQKGTVSSLEASSFDKMKAIPKEVVKVGVKVPFKALTLSQFVDFGQQLQRTQGAKMTGLFLEASKDHDHYLDVQFELASFTLPVVDEPIAVDSKRPSKGPRPKRK